jgi:hypothetical protein
MSTKFVRALSRAAVGALTGAAAGGLSFGLDASLDVGSSFIGATRDWWPLAAVFGALAGAVVGAGVGLYIGLSGLGRRAGVIVGCLVGVLGGLVLLFMNSDRFSWHLRSVPARLAPLLVSLFGWALIGLFLSRIASKLPSASR